MKLAQVVVNHCLHLSHKSSRLPCGVRYAVAVNSDDTHVLVLSRREAVQLDVQFELYLLLEGAGDGKENAPFAAGPDNNMPAFR